MRQDRDQYGEVLMPWLLLKRFFAFRQLRIYR